MNDKEAEDALLKSRLRCGELMQYLIQQNNDMREMLADVKYRYHSDEFHKFLQDQIEKNQKVLR